MKIICVGLNYPSHNKEMERNGNDIPNEPILFLKPDSALLKDGKTFYIPDFSQNIHYEAEIVVKINRLGKNIAERFAHRYYEELTIGIDFTARDLQDQLKSKGLPWEISKGFDNSAVIGDFIHKETVDVNNLKFELEINRQSVQSGNTAEMIHSIDKIIAYASQFFTLKMGDLIFTGTPSGVGTIKIGDQITGSVQEQQLLAISIN